MSEHAGARAHLSRARGAAIPDHSRPTRGWGLTLTTACLLARHPGTSHWRSSMRIDTNPSANRSQLAARVSAAGSRANGGSWRSLRVVLAAQDHSLARETPLPAINVTPAAVIKPLSPASYKVQLTVTKHTHDKLRRVQDSLRHVVPDGDSSGRILIAIAASEAAPREEAGHGERRREVRTRNSAQRHESARVRREVWDPA